MQTQNHPIVRARSTSAQLVQEGKPNQARSVESAVSHPLNRSPSTVCVDLGYNTETKRDVEQEQNSIARMIELLLGQEKYTILCENCDRINEVLINIASVIFALSINCVIGIIFCYAWLLKSAFEDATSIEEFLAILRLLPLPEFLAILGVHNK